MVKYGKKFFYNENSSQSGKTKKGRRKKNESNASLGLFFEKLKYFFRKALPIIGIIVLIILIIVYVKGCQKNQKRKNEQNNTPTNVDKLEAQIRPSITIDLDDTVPTIDRFVKNYAKIKTENDSITYDDTNFADNKYNSVGEYKVTIIVNGKEYKSSIIVTDKKPPIMALQEVIITEGEEYSITDFISSCSDNSGKECVYSYTDQKFDKYTAAGTYDIGIYASDTSGNKTEAQTTKLIINTKQNGGGTKPNGGSKNGCQFGDGTSPVSTPLAYSLVKNNCAVDPAYAKTNTYISVPEKMGREDLARLKDEFIKSGINAEIKTEFNVIPIFNTTAKGLIGYQIEIIASNNKTGEVIEHYYVNSNKTRTYVVNKLNFR